MKRLIFLSVFLMLAVSAQAAEPVFLSGWNSKYDVTQGAVTVSSSTVLTFAAVSDGYRKVTLTNSTSWFYLLGSTIGITTSGFPVAANVNQDIETNLSINILNPASVASGSGRYIEKKK